MSELAGKNWAILGGFLDADYADNTDFISHEGRKTQRKISHRFHGFTLFLDADCADGAEF
jgi:hypothetical protein